MSFPQPPYIIRVQKVTHAGIDVSGASIKLENITKATDTTKISNEVDSNIAINLADLGNWSIGDSIKVTATYGGDSVSSVHTVATADCGVWNVGILATGVNIALRPSIFPRVFDVYFRSYAKGIFFDGIELKNPEPFTKPKRPLINSVILESGKQSVQASIETAFAGTFKCHTGNHANVADLYAKIGTKANLVVDEYTYANCYISSFSELQWFPREWNYEVSFIQETA